MKCRIEILNEERTGILEVDQGTSLLSSLQSENLDVYAPCGGNGTCNKCKIIVKGIGTVLSCQFTVETDISVVLPVKLEMEVLVSQHEHTVVVPFVPDHAAQKSSYPLGMAIDIGTTTIAAYLVNLITGVLTGIRTAVNPQVKYGGDIISRINMCGEDSEGLKKLQTALVHQINVFINDFAAENNVESGFITKITVAGNNTMLHLLAGVDPKSLALAPFTPVFVDQQLLDPESLGLDCHAEALVSLLPSVSAYLGADILAGIASLKDDGTEPFLYIDIGTNGEMALVSQGKIWCCATAAGPAFEGANISCGSGAVTGAVSAYSARGLTTIGYAKPASVCGSGLVDIVSYLLEESLISEDGILNEDFVVSPASENAGSSDIIIKQQDIRELQLAKGAIAAGISILLKQAGLVLKQVSKLYLAGGFGNYMNTESAMNIGLIPEEMKGKTVLIGNAAGTGAMLALKSSSFIEKIERTRQLSEYIELSYDPDFPLEFALNMNFRREP